MTDAPSVAADTDGIANLRPGRLIESAPADFPERDAPIPCATPDACTTQSFFRVHRTSQLVDFRSIGSWHGFCWIPDRSDM